MTWDVLVVGAGAAGMAAALAAARAGASVLLADRGERLGGVLPQCLHTGFGMGIFRRELTGADYAARWADMVRAAPIALRLDTTVLSISPDRRALQCPETEQVRHAHEGVAEVREEIHRLQPGRRTPQRRQHIEQPVDHAPPVSRQI